MQEYYLDPKRGIYTYEYHSERSTYWVNFEGADVDNQFRAFLWRVEDSGKAKAMVELKQQFNGLRELLR